MDYSNTPAVADDHRRKFYAASYVSTNGEKDTDKAFLRRELLRPRDEKIDLESKLGKSIIVTRTTAPSDAGGYYCKVCDCVVKDSINYLDHINGKKHQRNLGMSMKIEQSSVEKVRMRFEVNKRKSEQVASIYDIDERLQEIKEEEEKLKSIQKERRQRKKSRFDNATATLEGTNDVFADDIGELMGFSSFGGSKKNN
ncbi:hypothetical protein GJ496_000019 [Pomphorhynchus laevis]|nr:hypothetical protein GJ496_000019 [Pomphorhynchus laevis]